MTPIRFSPGRAPRRSIRSRGLDHRIALILSVAAAAAPAPGLAQPLPSPGGGSPSADSQPAQLAQARGSSTAALPAVVVTGTRQESRLDDQVAHVTVVEREELERATGRTLSEFLGAQAGIQSTANGGLGATSAVFIRGLESRHTLLLIDGVRYGSATAGGPILEGIPLEQIERIEIVRGPMSSLYGSDAVGGVIQVFTRRGTAGFRPFAAATIGNRRFGSLAAGVSGGEDRWDYAVSAQHLRTDGFSATNPNVPFGNYNPDDDGFRQSSLAANVGWRFLPDWQARASVFESFGRSDFDDGQPAGNPGIDSQARLRTQVLAASVEGTPRAHWRTTVRASRSEDRYDTIRAASAFSIGEFRTTQDQYTWENGLRLPLGNLLIGLERLEQSVQKPPPAYDVASRSIDAAWIGYDLTRAVHHLQASARHDRNSQYGSQNTGTVGYGYDISPAWRVGASYGTSFVAPSFNQLYFPDFGTPDLKPEEGRHRELNLRYARAGHEWRLARHESRIRGYITSGPQPTNVPRSEIDGWELAWTGTVAGFGARASIDWLDPRNETTGKVLQRRARRTASMALDRPIGDWRVGGLVRTYDERFDDAANTRRLGGFTLIDLYADWRVAPSWTIGAKVNNLADKRYETAFGYGQQGRAMFLTARYAPR